MTQITLSNEQLATIKDKLAQAHNENDAFSVEIDLGDGLSIVADGWVEIDGYTEDDYHRGTGAFVETFRSASVQLTGWAYDHLTEEENEVEIAPESVKVIDEYLNAA